MEAKYFKLNASTRLARPKYSDKKPFQLLAKLPLEAFEVDRDNIRQDFGVRLRSEKNSVTVGGFVNVELFFRKARKLKKGEVKVIYVHTGTIRQIVKRLLNEGRGRRGAQVS